MRRCRKLRDSLLSRPRRQVTSRLRRSDLDLEEGLRSNELRYHQQRNRRRKVALVTAGFPRPILATFRRPPNHQGRDLHRRRRASSEHIRRGLRRALVGCQPFLKPASVRTLTSANRGRRAALSHRCVAPQAMIRALDRSSHYHSPCHATHQSSTIQSCGFE